MKLSHKPLLASDFFLVVVTLLLTAMFVYASMRPTDPAPQARAVVVETKKTEAVMETADTPELRAKGLRGHAPLDDTHGLVLRFEKPSIQCIWNKGVGFPVDAGFYGEDGKLFGGVTMKANDTDQVCTKKPVLNIVEMRGGWFKEHL
jgi:uncharacterized membrane protein (UPF0127 family)